MVYIVGGLNERNEELQSVDVYNPVTERLSRTSDMQTKRAYVGTAVVDGFIYAVGGWNEKDGALPTVERYSVTEVQYHCTIVHTGKISYKNHKTNLSIFS